jgi:hypothetical protein
MRRILRLIFGLDYGGDADIYTFEDWAEDWEEELRKEWAALPGRTCQEAVITYMTAEEMEKVVNIV